MLKLRDIMTTDVVTLTPDTTLRDAADVLARRHLSGAPVVRGTDVVGVLSTSDLLEFAGSQPGIPTDAELEPGWTEIAASDDDAPPPEEPSTEAARDDYYTDAWPEAEDDALERTPAVEGPEWSALDQHTVEEVMTRTVYTLGPDEGVTAAARLMNNAGIHRVVITDQGRLVGLVTATDLAKAVAQHRVQRRTYVFRRRSEADQRDVD